ncbi:MAG: hypothetical protein IJP66_00910, partial [Kiritimatiellae bacterium]|nr:hypothetical protein [Kiritimatiellia bacterium]
MVEWGKAAAATIVAAAMAAAMPCAAGEAIAIGEDILRNGVLLPGGDGYPPEWDLSYECRIGRNAFFEPVGGAGAAGPASHAVRFAAQGWKPRTLTLRQFDIKLSTAGVYRLSGRIRTRGLRCRSSGLVVADSGWENDYGVSPLPADTGGEWREVAAEVRLSPSADGLYSVAFYAQGLAAGELEMSDCRLVALDAEAAAGAGRSGLALNMGGPRSVAAAAAGPSDGDAAGPPGDVPGKCLNNLVCELVSRECGDGETVAFDASRDGWLHIALDGGEDASASLDGAVAIASGARRREAFRRVAAGRHEIAVLREGLAPSGPQGSPLPRLAVREIPEILNYCPFTSPAVAENPPRPWEWLERNVFPATTTQIGGDIPAWRLCDFKAMGGVWLGNLVTRGLADDGDLARRLAAAPALAADDPHDGLTCDEQAFDRASHLNRYTAGLKRFCADYRGGKSIYTWLIGRAAPMHRGADEEFIAAAADAPGGRIL